MVAMRTLEVRVLRVLWGLMLHVQVCRQRNVLVLWLFLVHGAMRTDAQRIRHHVARSIRRVLHLMWRHVALRMRVRLWSRLILP